MGRPSSSAAAAWMPTYLQFEFDVFGKVAEFGSRGWITTGCVDLPSISEVLPGEFEPESSVGTND